MEYEKTADLLRLEYPHRGHMGDGRFHERCRYCEWRREHGGNGIPAFRVVDQTRGRVFLETDDWVAAEQLVRLPAADATPGGPRLILGTHPSHDWDAQYPHCCRVCRVEANGRLESHAPCGYDMAGRDPVTVIEAEVAARKVKEGTRDA